jgi:excinuclease ABC subunit C
VTPRTFTKRLEKRDVRSVEELDFERAARLRDDIGRCARAGEAGRRAGRRHRRRRGRAGRGRARGRRAGLPRPWRPDPRSARLGGRPVEALTDAELVEHLLQQLYGDAPGGDAAAGATAGAVPREVLVPVLPPDLEQVQTWLSGLRGGRVQVRVPQRGDKHELAETVRKNAEHALALHRTRRAGDLTTRSQALQEIQEALALESAPLRIECYDVSHNQGTYQVASMVVFEDGLARKSEYRTFSVRGAEGTGARDDTEAMHEVITRRFRRYLAERDQLADPELGLGEDQVAEALADADAGPVRSGPVDESTGRPQRFAYPPNLVVVDGGPPQVAAAAAALAELGIDDVALCGLAKRLEEVWLPGEDYPVILQRSSEGLYLLQRVRDEAHRFAINAHRKKRSKGMTVSALDSVPGLGPARSAALLKHFGSLRRLKLASAEEIATVPGMGARTAAAVVAALAGNAPLVEPTEAAADAAGMLGS